MARHWRESAACIGMNPDDFIFRSHATRTNLKVERAKSVCAGCPVLQQCLDAELSQMRAGVASVGIFGGTTTKERNQMLHEERANAHQRALVYVPAPKRRLPQGCGTNAGYQRHIEQGAPPCDDCRQARREYQAQWRRSWGAA